MQKLTLIFARVDKPISQLIRFVTRSSWSHVGIVDGEWVYESVGGYGVVKTPLKDFIARYDMTQQAYIEVRSVRRVIAKAESLLGKKYDTKGALGYMFGRDWNHPDFFQCAEYVDESIGLVRKEKQWKMTPEFFWMLSKDISRDFEAAQT